MSETIAFEALDASEIGYQDYEIDSFSNELAEVQGPSASVSETENQNSESLNAVGLNIESDPLTPLIEAHASDPVKCPWLNDEVVTLSAAVLAYSEKVALITEENIHAVAAVMLDLLANRLEETEEPEEENESEEEELSRPKEIKKPEKEKAAKKEVKSKSVEKEPAKTKAADQKSKTKAEDRQEQKQPPTNATNKSVKVTEQINPAGSSASETQKPLAESVIRSSLKPAEDEAAASPASAITALSDEGVVAGAERRFAVNEPEMESDGPSLIAIRDMEALPRTIGTEDTVESEVVTLAGSGIEKAVAADAAVEPADEVVNLNEGSPGLTVPESQVGVDDITDFEDGEILLIEHAEDADQQSDGQYEQFDLPAEAVARNDLKAEGVLEEAPILGLDTDVELSWQPAGIDPERPVKTSLPIEQIEDSLARLAELIEANGPQEAEELSEFLDKIVSVPARLESERGENIINESEVKEEIEELFTQLLDRAGIAFTPELVESLARLTIEWRLADEVEKLKDEEDTKEAPKDRGTHEIIKTLMTALCTIKSSIARAGAIGKSALRLYSFSYAA